MLTKRIIPCLDVKNGRVVKGINFVNLKDAGDPAELAGLYSSEGADELVLLDISASEERRTTMAEWVKAVADRLTIPFTVGGGISSTEQAREIIALGADKISLNTAAVKDPSLIERCSRLLGSQAVVVAVDVKRENDRWAVYIQGGAKKTDLDGLEWVEKVQKLGCGEILLTSMDGDGTEAGYDLELLRRVSLETTVPVIASGGAGKEEHILQAFRAGADAALAASIFHYGKLRIGQVKDYLAGAKIPVRI
ncbi:imidazole glycerol phosphate synthase subunit HisF [Dethiosulfovibrio sp. F2B]|uniref:imidazole glycerol phosphate synthase subunit HisF n=1 Tax=Dethiosulfovibrio faecalis TaxID=2720018 RepID=UPI001F480216|nr:imidazole glycerol phosphate synthase subunit HisF [Dethiosulfovibrio faecalis]MCF4152499.1 imidazole glycerol phosphate synthase subunit HisF [Dethiosulfovibrio faecalis]